MYSRVAAYTQSKVQSPNQEAEKRPIGAARPVRPVAVSCVVNL